MKNCTVMVGHVGSGKSSYAKYHADMYGGVVASSDQFIEAEAVKQGKTYGEVFNEAKAPSTEKYWALMDDAIEHGRDIVIDRMNLTKKARKVLINKFKAAGYVVACVYVHTSKAIRDSVNEERKKFGRDIRQDIRNVMEASFEVPTEDEGFTSVRYVERTA